MFAPHTENGPEAGEGAPEQQNGDPLPNGVHEEDLHKQYFTLNFDDVALLITDEVLSWVWPDEKPIATDQDPRRQEADDEGEAFLEGVDSDEEEPLLASLRNSKLCPRGLCLVEEGVDRCVCSIFHPQDYNPRTDDLTEDYRPVRPEVWEGAMPVVPPLHLCPFKQCLVREGATSCPCTHGDDGNDEENTSVLRPVGSEQQTPQAGRQAQQEEEMSEEQSDMSVPSPVLEASASSTVYDTTASTSASEEEKAPPLDEDLPPLVEARDVQESDSSTSGPRPHRLSIVFMLFWLIWGKLLEGLLRVGKFFLTVVLTVLLFGLLLTVAFTLIMFVLTFAVPVIPVFLLLAFLVNGMRSWVLNPLPLVQQG